VHLQASDDEYQMREKGVQPWSSPDGVPADPWKCLHGCDKEASCRGVFITKVEASWACWFVRGTFGLGSNACSIKAAPAHINTYYWSFASANTSTSVGAADELMAGACRELCSVSPAGIASFHDYM
jgi:hypothetical protein